ncbi:MAG: AMP-binding protein, partial [Microbacteriaceae bacterium]|nr:AMP-binding protein [Microbacteriaceae bacterium]
MADYEIESLLSEERRFPPPASIAEGSIARPDLYEQAREDRLAFWGDRAREYVTWTKPFTEVLDWSGAPVAKWFADGELNVAANCLDRHVDAGLGDRIAIRWEGEPGDVRTITYAELTADVRRAANALHALGVGQGDRVAIYLPVVPEAVVAMLAVARLGAVHSVVFGGFSAQSLHDRILDAGAKLVITADGGYRRGKVFPLKAAVDEALVLLGDRSPVEHVLV